VPSFFNMMKRIIPAILLIVIVQGFFSTIISQNTSTQGKEFWVSFSHNVDDPDGVSVDPLKLSLVVSAKRACTGTITNPYTGWSVPFSVVANGTVSINIDSAQAYVTTSEKVEHKALLVTATDTISLYASNYEFHTFDVANVLPIESLSDKYMIQTYATMKDATAANIYLGAEMLIIATEDNTVVNITPTTVTEKGKPANTPFSVTLNKGEVYQVLSSSTTYPAGFSGSLVTTDDCKKIAVFNGNRGSNVPVGYSGIDYLVEQALPTSGWGTKFAVTSTNGQRNDRIEITALNNNTKIYRDGTLATTIGSGQTYEFELTSTQGSSYIETSQPCAVYQYLTGVNYGGGGVTGDPSMFWVAPIEQKIKEIAFATYGTSVVSNHYVNIVLATTDVNSVLLDGVAIGSQFKPVTGNLALSYASVSITNATHLLKCSGGFIADVYGLGSWVSYAYTVGSNTINLNTQFEVDGVLNSLISTDTKYCVGKNIVFTSKLNYVPDSVYWYFDNIYSGKGNTITQSFSSGGFHKVTMKVKKPTGCFDSVSVTLKTLSDTTRIDTTITKGQSYAFGGKTYTDNATDTLRLKNISGCDSTVILNLSVLELPDNVKQVDCYSIKNVKNFPWGMRLAQTSDAGVDEIYTPLAGDLDNDGIPEIVVTQGYWAGHSTGKMQVFEGNDLSKKSQAIDLGVDVDYYCGAHVVLIRVPDKLNPVDTLGLIIVHTESGLRSYKYDGINNITLFKSNTISVPEGTIASADFNNDGIPEVYCGNMVFDAYSLDLIGTGTSNSALSYFHWTPERVSYAADVLPNVPGTELICGSVIYAVDVANKAVNVVKTITPPTGFTSEGQTEVADFNGDGLPDVLVKQNSTTFGVYAYDPRTGKILFTKSIASGTEQNFPMIGDIDADKKAEIVLLYENTMKAYKYDGTNLNEFWSLPIQDASGSTGMTLFDFNQDGLKEIVYRDEVNLRIINGSKKSHLTGADTTVYNLSIFPVASKTIAEYPIVVDCDADGEAEILLQGRASGSTSSRLHMFKSFAKGAWAPARTVWNQYAYNVTNVNENLTIPKTLFNNATYFPNGKQPFNNFQEQATLINKNGDPFFKAQFDTTRIDTSILKGQSYTFGTKTYTSSAKDTLILKSTSGCDSVAILNLSVLALKSYKYVACPSSLVTLEVVKETGKSYAWYSTKKGGTLLDSDTMLVYTKTTASVDTVWLQINAGSRVPVPIYLSTICASTTPAVCPGGTILFKEDFGGNNPSDPDVKPTGIPQVSYTYDPGMLGWGLYSIRKVTHPHYGGIWYRSDDHTFSNDSTRGYLMQVDATEAAGQFYTYTLSNVCPGSHLTFSCWMKSLMNNLNYPSKANVIFQLLKPNGDMVAKYYSGDVPDKDNTWKQYGFDFYSPLGSDTLVLNIINNGTGSHGNDFVMDDIEIRLCVPPVTVSISPNDTVCLGSAVSINSQFVNDGSFTEPLAYKWFKKVNATDSWTDLSTNAQSLTLNQLKQSDQGYYRVAVSSTGSIGYKNCRAMSDSVYLKVVLPDTTRIDTSILKGKTYTFGKNTYSKAIRDTLTLKNSLGCDSIVILNLSVLAVPDNVEYATCYTQPASFTFGIKQLAASGADLVTTTTPMVGDVDGDGKTEILCFVKEDTPVNFPSYKNIYIFDGKTLALKGSITTPYCKNGHVLAIADVDGVGGNPPYIFIASDSTAAIDGEAMNTSGNAFYVFAYKYDASSKTYVQVWQSDKQMDAASASTSMRVADLNNDGVPEVIAGAYVFNAQTGVLLAKNDLLTQSVPNTRQSDYLFPLLPYIGNLVGDNNLELAYMNELYSVKLTNTNAFNANAFTKLSAAPSELKNKIGNFVGGDFNNDGHVDLVMVNRTNFSETTSNTLEIVVWDVYNNKLLASAQTPVPCTSADYFFLIGVPLVGDVNGDGVPEVCFITKNKMYCYAYNGTTTLSKFWDYDVGDPSGNTGITLFDFNQDGKQEIVYRDEDDLHIIDGSTSTPTEKTSILCASPTANEMAVVADVNNDGAAEIVVIGGTYHRAGTGKLRVYGSSTANMWAPARPVWNQMAYNVINVNKDLTIPKVQFNPATLFSNGKRPFNAYLQQATTINQDGNPFFKLTMDTTIIDTSIVKGQTYTFGTKTYSTAVVDTLMLTNVSGCDSMVILNLSVYPDNIELQNCYKKPASFEFKIKQIGATTENLPTYGTPIAGDIDGDGETEILTFSEWTLTTAGNNYVSKNINIYNGKTLALKSKITTPVAKWGQVIALGDVDGAGGEPPYIFFVADSTYGGNTTQSINSAADALHVFAYKYDKASKQYVQVWRSDKSVLNESSNAPIQVADINNDGSAEVIVGKNVFNGKTGVLLARNNITSLNDGMSFGHTINPFVGNLLGDSKLELAYNDSVYSVDIQNPNAFNPNAFKLAETTPVGTKIGYGNPVGADFNLDGYTDLVLVKKKNYNVQLEKDDIISIAIWDVHNNKILATAQTPNISLDASIYRYWYVSVGVPSLGDINNDGVPEICFITSNNMFCYAYNGTTTLLKYWNYAVDDPSGSTGMTLFDFNQDNKLEIVYRDQSSLHIFDGSVKDNCKSLATIGSCYSGTGSEMPIIADVNNDNSAEIITVGSLSTTSQYQGPLRVYASGAANSWAPARPVWNQTAYNVVNVNKDLTIPKVQFNPATLFPNKKRPFNAYLQQATTINQEGDMFFAVKVDTIITKDTICANSLYIFHGDTITKSGTYTYSPSCDSVMILKLLVNPAKTKTITDSICSGSTYSFYGTPLTKSGAYKKVFTTSLGCDSTIVLNFTVLDKKHVTKIAGLCSKGSYTFAGQTLTVPGTYSHTYPASNGCDSIITLILKKDLIDTSYVDVSIKQGEIYPFNGQKLTTAGTYNQKTKTVAGCDSLIILNLVVNSLEDTILVVPAQGFSPNGDGVNDYFVITNIEQYPNNHIIIFNRWGNKVYEGKPYMNQWDGKNYFGLKVGGDLLPVGTYFYILDLGNGSKIKKGFVYLNR